MNKSHINSLIHYSDVIMSMKTSQIAGASIICPTVCSGADQRKTSKLRVTGLCEGNSPVTGEFPAQKASNVENGSIWWRHHDCSLNTSTAILHDGVTKWKRKVKIVRFNLPWKIIVAFWLKYEYFFKISISLNVNNTYLAHWEAVGYAWYFLYLLDAHWLPMT